ncbi:MAG TPA: hydroxymethylbilane synthase [Cyclobacteriaceae bacterium]|nr:hydroxymethylbilane synthase [Cyclobacteriaceae bacterium]
MTRSNRLRIGTRHSALAIYQAKAVQEALQQINIDTEIIEITSDGDVDLVTPLYEMGIQGIFTKTLDVALLESRIDLAVHSTKDVPTRQAKGLTLSATLPRATPFDCLVLPKGQSVLDFSATNIIATSSLRRKLQWLNRYPEHQTESLRGNIQTRLSKLDSSGWQGAIFAQAALERLRVTSNAFITLDWMLPSPAQGAIGIVCRENDSFALEACRAINHQETEICISIERDFLAVLHGGCSVPIAAYAFMEGDDIRFHGNIMSLDAKQKCEVQLSFARDEAQHAGQLAAKKILSQGAEVMIKTFKRS